MVKEIGKFMGAYPVRNLGRGENGIHMPNGVTGRYSIYLFENGNVVLVPAKNASERDIDYVF